jgi:Protein of unknown function (DUF4242)
MNSTRSHGQRDEEPQTFLVEHYWPDATPDAFRTSVARVRAAVDNLAGSGAPLRFLHSTFVPEEESALCVFSSPAAGLVEQAYRRAGVSFERILSVLEIAPGEPAEQPTNED